MKKKPATVQRKWLYESKWELNPYLQEKKKLELELKNQLKVLINHIYLVEEYALLFIVLKAIIENLNYLRETICLQGDFLN